MSSILIRGGNLHDGERFLGVGDLLIAGDTIEAIGQVSIPADSDIEILDAAGCVVSPGFIECHNMTQEAAHLDGNDALNLLAQGVTTCVIGNCGMSGPLKAADGLLRQLELLRNARLGLNVGSLLGHNSLRQFAVAAPTRPSLPEEIEVMTRILEEALDAGFLGFSSGLMYAPGRSAAPEELIALTTIVGRKDKVYTSHIRDEGDEIRESVTEALDSARAGRARLVVSHLKAAGKANWGKAREMTHLMAGRRNEQEAYVSFYPYTATSTVLRAVIPDRVLETTGGNVSQLNYNEHDAQIVEALGLQRYAENGWNDVVIVSSAAPEYIGQSIGEIAGGSNAYGAVLDILHRDLNTRVVFYNIASESELREIAALPWAMVASDGYVYPTGSQQATHPRNYGAFARVVKDYVNAHGVMSIEEFVRRVTSLPAQVFRMARRGALKRGYCADVAVFRTEEVGDLSDYTKPCVPATGLRYTLVNGLIAYRDNRATAVYSGRYIA